MAKKDREARILEQTHVDGQPIEEVTAQEDAAIEVMDQAVEQGTKPAAVQPAVGEKVVKKKNQAILVQYLGDEGADGVRKEFSGPNPQVRAMKVITRAGEQLIELAKLSPDVVMCAAIFGFNTAWRNTHNSNENNGKDGIAAMNARIAANLQGAWSAEGEAAEQGTPLVIEAMIAAKRKLNAYSEGMEKKWLDHYYALDAKGRVAQTNEWLKNDHIKAAHLVIKAQRAAEAANAALAKVGEEAVSADF